jgi:hypothetical protein
VDRFLKAVLHPFERSRLLVSGEKFLTQMEAAAFERVLQTDYEVRQLARAVQHRAGLGDRGAGPGLDGLFVAPAAPTGRRTRRGYVVGLIVASKPLALGWVSGNGQQGGDCGQARLLDG